MVYLIGFFLNGAGRAPPLPLALMTKFRSGIERVVREGGGRGGESINNNNKVTGGGGSWLTVGRNRKPGFDQREAVSQSVGGGL